MNNFTECQKEALESFLKWLEGDKLAMLVAYHLSCNLPNRHEIKNSSPATEKFERCFASVEAENLKLLGISRSEETIDNVTSRFFVKSEGEVIKILGVLEFRNDIDECLKEIKSRIEAQIITDTSLSDVPEEDRNVILRTLSYAKDEQLSTLCEYDLEKCTSAINSVLNKDFGKLKPFQRIVIRASSEPYVDQGFLLPPVKRFEIGDIVVRNKFGFYVSHITGSKMHEIEIFIPQPFLRMAETRVLG